MAYNVLSKPLNEYTKAGLTGAFSLARAKGRGLKSAEGVILLEDPSGTTPSPVKTPEQKVNTASGVARDNNKVAASLNIAGLTHIAPSVNHSNIGGNAGFFSYQRPYITIITKPPIGTEDLNKYIGLPLEAKKALNAVTGYTEVSNIFLPDSANNIMLKEEELEIRELLNGGVIL